MDDSEVCSAATVEKLVEAIRPILAGYPHHIQGSVLSDCVAIWLAGYDIPGDEDGTRAVRANLLELHCSEVRELVPINARIMGTTP